MADEAKTEAAPKPPEKLTIQQIAKDITDDAGVESAAIPHMHLFIDPTKTKWEHGKPAPTAKDKLVIFAMFRSGEDVHVYCVPIVDNVPFSRFVLSRQAESLVSESMGLDVFKAEVAREIRSVYEDTNEADFERELIVGYLRSLPGDYAISEAIADIEGLAHQEVPDDGDAADETPTASGETAPASPPS